MAYGEVEGRMEIDDREAFTLEQVLRLNSLSRRRLLYWIEKSVISTDIEATRPRGPIRLFSFRNLLEVRVAVWLRDKLSLQLIRKILERLRAQGFEHPLSTITSASSNRTFLKPDRKSVV